MSRREFVIRAWTVRPDPVSKNARIEENIIHVLTIADFRH